MAVLLASTMMLATGMSAMAQVVVPEHSTQQEGTAQITVANASRGENYCIYKLFAASVTGKENGPIAYTGTVPEELLEFFYADDARNVRATEAAVDENGEMSSGLKDALTEWVKTAKPVAEAVSDGSTLHFNNLDYGYYIVTTTQGSQAITVDSTNPTRTLYDKNSTGPSIPEDGKTVDDEKVHIGEPLTYTIKFNTSNYDGAGTGAKQILSYTVKDTLPEFLSDVKLTSIMVDNDANLETTEDQVQFSVNDILQYGGNFATDGMITIPWVEQNANPTSENDTEGNYKSLYENGAMVVITYTATVTDQAVIDGDGNTNTFTLTWNVGEETHGGENYTDTATVYTYAIALKKVDAKGNALADAKFQFPFYVKETPSEKDGAYIYAGEEPGERLINEITTPEDGIIVVKGVDGDVIAENENDNGKYVIYEIEAPKGYNLLTEPVKIAPQMTKATNTTKTFYLDEQGNITSEETNTTVEYVNEQLSTGIALVVNHAGIELPSTGGIGTTIFAFAGLLLMAGAAGVMIIKKRG